MTEVWKPIIIKKNGEVYDFTGKYEVSNHGRVKSLHRGGMRILKIKPNKQGYKQARLQKNGKDKLFSVHRLVATAFIPNPDNLPVVNHIDENPSNNRVDNLEWCTQQHNTQHSSHKWKEKSKPEEWKQSIKRAGNPNAKKVICLETGEIFSCIKEAHEKYGGDIGGCCRGVKKTAGGYHWMYYDEYLEKGVDSNE